MNMLRKLVWTFCVAWAVVCLILTGGHLLQVSTFRGVRVGPTTAQDRAGSIYNQGARIVYREHLLNTDKAVLIDEYDSLEHLSVHYWLYPVRLVDSRYGNNLTQALQHPEQKAIVYVGPQDTYTQALATLDPTFTATVVKTTGGDVFAIIQRL